ncbi:MAG: glycosyltransferase [Cyanothece sp. SIO2G6]|nr:glycosyltransferase [Cyanothece sp. SIO2G6]
MSFPVHDQYWMDVADFLSAHITANDDILAPKEFEYRFVHCFTYPLSYSVPALGFQWVVVHKGNLAKLALSFLMDAVQQLRPVYTNPVFVVLSSHELPVVETNNDLLDFNQRLRSLLENSPPAQTPAPLPNDPDVLEFPLPSSQSKPPTPDPAPQYAPPAHTNVKVSVITVCYNAAETIERTIQAVATQIYPNIEYIVVDGASDDGTLAVCDRHSQVITQLVSEPDDGIYQAMNKGIHLATGDWLYFANADDYLFDPYVIQDLVAFVLDHPETDVVYGDHEARFPDGTASVHAPVPPEKMLETVICLEPDRIHQPACLFKTAVFQQLGNFSEDYHIASDYKWFIDALPSLEKRLAYIPRTVVSYAHGGASGNIRALFDEVFAIQRQNSLCQEPDWLKRQLALLQQEYIDKYERLEATHYRAIRVDQKLQQSEQLVNIRTCHLKQLKQRLHSDKLV